MIKKSTYTRALEACEAFFIDTGQVPTIETIKPLIGVNSPSTISSAIKDWKRALATTIKTDQGALPGVPAALTDALQGCWQLALAEARQVFTEKVDELQAQQAALADQDAALKVEAERMQQVLQFAEQAYQDKITHLSKDNDRLSAETQRLTEQSEYYRSQATAVEKTHAVLTETIRQEQDKVQRLEIHYDKEHDWALMRIEEEKDNHRLQTQQEMRRCQAETQRSQQALELLQAKYAMAITINEQNRDRITELERNLSNEKLKLAEVTLQAAHLQKELNNKDERLRLMEAKQNKRIK
ncbi:MAG: DNA-binding protein [Methylobacter sp.]|nr:DNA-binding protein [Methylobacter sp.]